MSSCSSSIGEGEPSPFFIHPSDNPGLSLVSQPLVGDNFNSWKRAMYLALQAKNKIGFVDGTIPKPDLADPMLHAWKRNNSIVASWLLNSVSKEISASLINSTSAAAIWRDLHERFGQKNGPRIFQIQKELISCSQGSLSITNYFTKSMSLWEDLNEYRPMNTCHCGALKPFLDHIRMEYVLLFLMGLNESYAHIRGQILLMDPIPPISRVLNLLLQEEEQREQEQECEELHRNMDNLKDEKSKLTHKLVRLYEECLELSNENDSIQEELVKMLGPESIADLMAMKPAPMKHASGRSQTTVKEESYD